MEFFKIKMFRKARNPNTENILEDMPVPEPEEPNCDNNASNYSSKTEVEVDRDFTADVDDDDDDEDDFITNEVKRRLKELRRNSFMVLIPEEDSCVEEEEDEEDSETISNQWRDVEAQGRQWWSGFDAVYDKYCEHMFFFDRMSASQLNQTGPLAPSTPSPRSASKKLTSPFRCLSLKRIEEPEEETEHLQQIEDTPYHDLETAYVAQTCLTWEALHCQYTQLSQKISRQPENPTCYNHSAQQFQQFVVLLQRFIENEPFEQGVRVEIYARTRKLLPKLLQVPNVKASDLENRDEEKPDFLVRIPYLIRIIESSILTFHQFLKMEKRRASGLINLFGNQNHIATPLQQIRCSLEKKKAKLKELWKRKTSWKNKSWPETYEEIQLLFGLIDVKIISMALGMVRISTEQLFWCEEKMKKLDMSNGKLQRDPSPILFPC